MLYSNPSQHQWRTDDAVAFVVVDVELEKVQKGVSSDRRQHGEIGGQRQQRRRCYGKLAGTHWTSVAGRPHFEVLKPTMPWPTDGGDTAVVGLHLTVIEWKFLLLERWWIVGAQRVENYWDSALLDEPELPHWFLVGGMRLPFFRIYWEIFFTIKNLFHFSHTTLVFVKTRNFNCSLILRCTCVIVLALISGRCLLYLWVCHWVRIRFT